MAEPRALREDRPRRRPHPEPACADARLRKRPRADQIGAGSARGEVTVVDHAVDTMDESVDEVDTCLGEPQRPPLLSTYCCLIVRIHKPQRRGCEIVFFESTTRARSQWFEVPLRKNRWCHTKRLRTISTTWLEMRLIFVVWL